MNDQSKVPGQPEDVPSEAASAAQPADAAKPAQSASIEDSKVVAESAASAVNQSAAAVQSSEAVAAQSSEVPSAVSEAVAAQSSEVPSAVSEAVAAQSTLQSGMPQQPGSPSGMPQQPANLFEGTQSQQPTQSNYAPPQPAQPYAQYTQQAGQPYYGQPANQSGKAIGALVCGILAIVFSFMPFVGIILGIVALILASKAIKESGKSGKTTGAKACGIAGIVLSVLTVVLYIVILVVYQAADFNDSTSNVIANPPVNSIENSGSVNPSDPSTTDSNSDARSAVEAKLSTLTNMSDADLQAIATLADKGFYENLDMHMSDVGIDPLDYARWITEGVTYKINTVIAESSYDAGSASVDIKVRDVFALISNYNDKLEAFVDNPDSQNLTQEQAKAKCGALFYEAMAETNDYTTNTASYSLTKTNGSWEVDQDSWDFELDYMFGLA